MQINAMAGKELSRVTVIDLYNYKVGERVVVCAREFNTGEVTGLFFTRYVCIAHSLPGHNVDEDITELWLSPFAPITETLGLSGVQNKCNLESN